MIRSFPHLAKISATSALILLGGAGWSQTSYTYAEMRVAAAESLKARDPRRADALAEAMLLRDENDLVALMIRARAHRDMGRYKDAQGFARTAWSLSDEPGERYASALIMAQALSSDGKRTRAQLWLRRAVQHAPSKAHEAKAKRDFRYVKQRNPWHTTLAFTIAPNSNINNGSARESSRLNYAISEVLFGQPIEYDLQGAARAIAGLEIGGSVQTRYRFHQTPTTAHDFKASLSYKTFRLNDTVEEDVPGISGSDFAYGTVSLGYGYRQINMERKGEFAFDTEIGQSWYAGSRYASFFRLSGQQTIAANARQRYRFGLNAERQIGQATSDVDSFGLSASLTQNLKSGDLAYFGVFAEATQSENADSEYAELSLRTGYVMRKPVMGAQLQFGLGAALRDYDVSRHAAEGRRDRKIFADVTATFSEIDYYGFNPTVTLSASSTDSNIGLFDVNRVGLRIGIRSAF